MNNNFIDARHFTFAPFPHPLHPDEPGDSGVLEIATSKKNPIEQYIVKTGYPELGCNEFMYHRVAKALGLYTQEAKLICGSKQYRRDPLCAERCTVRFGNKQCGKLPGIL
jgi:hypothetical protein